MPNHQLPTDLTPKKESDKRNLIMEISSVDDTIQQSFKKGSPTNNPSFLEKLINFFP